MNKPGKNGKFSEVLGNWTKRDTSNDGNAPFVVKLGTPRSMLRKKSIASPRSVLSFRKRVERQTSNSTDKTDVTTDTSPTSSLCITSSKSEHTTSRKACLGDRIKKFEQNVSSWPKKKLSVMFKKPQVPANQRCPESDNKALPGEAIISSPTLDAQALIAASSKVTAPRMRPTLVKQCSAQRSRRNHLLREASRRNNLGKTVKRNKSIVCTHRNDGVQAFSPPVFPKDYADKKIIFKALTSNFVFEDLAAVEIKAFLQAFEKIELEKGHIIINQGAVGDYFYVIRNGTVTFEVNGRSSGSATSGQSFGDLALLYASPHAATVRAASEPTELFRVDQRTFQYIMQSQTKEIELEKIALLRKLPFLTDLMETDLQRLASAMSPHRFEEDDYVVRKGEYGDAFYIVKDGSLAVTDISVGDTAYRGVTIGPGDYFGERALVTSETREANVRGLSSGTLFSIDRYTFEMVLGKFSRVIMKSQDRTKLQGVPVFQTPNLETTKYELLVSHIVDKTYKATDTIFKEDNDTVPAMYVIREGKVQLTTKDGNRKEVIEAGGYFGTEMLLADIRGQVSKSGTTSPDCTATVLGDTCTCGMLTLADCRLVLDTMALVDPQICHNPKNSRREFTRVSKRFSSSVRDSLRSCVDTRASVDSLARHSILGEGQFGEVWLVSADFEEMSESFALKIQSKEGPDAEGRIDEIRREAEVLQSLDHPCIVDLIQMYETDDLVYMLLGLVEGGELWNLIHREDDDGNWTSGIPHDHAKFYGLVVADTLAYIHSQNIVFRDLKPENVLIDEDGYPIIVDFGFAKVCTEKTYTFCGTPNYLAPEVITNRGHGAGVDHWALGVLIYEMLNGENPFYYEDMEQVALFEAICHEDYYPLDDTVCADAFDLIDRLLEKDPVQRLGMLSGRERDILTHDWFADLDLPRLQLRELEAPWIPPSKDAQL